MSMQRTLVAGLQNPGLSQSLILTTTITPDRLKKRGYEPLPDYYLKVGPQLNEPSLLSRDGVKGAPRQFLLAGPPTRLEVVQLICVVNFVYNFIVLSPFIMS